jgi:hypothetical protein
MILTFYLLLVVVIVVVVVVVVVVDEDDDTTDGQTVSPSWCWAPSRAHDQILHCLLSPNQGCPVGYVGCVILKVKVTIQPMAS